MNRKRLILTLPFLLYALGINPWFAPLTYDNILYWEGAKSLAYDGSYTLFGDTIRDWPPLFSFVLAIPMRLGIESLVLSKCLVLLSAFLAVQLSFSLLTRYDYPFPFLSALLFALLPSSLLWGTRLMSEWPYILLSLSLLYCLGSESRRSWLPLGALLAAALMTRHVGIALLPAVLAAGWRKERLFDGFSVCATGLGLFVLLWGQRLTVAVGTNETESYYSGLSILSRFEPFKLLQQIPDLLFHTHVWLAPELLSPLTLLVTAFIIVFYLERLRTHGLGALEVYLGTMIGILACKEYGKELRYLLPLAPFLLAAFLGGVSQITQGYKRLAAPVLGIWIVGLLSLNTALLSVGNLRDYNGLSVLASPSADQFYKGYWKDVYQASQWLREQPPSGPIGLSDFSNWKYLQSLSGRSITSAVIPTRLLLIDKRIPFADMPAGALLIEENAIFQLVQRPDTGNQEGDSQHHQY